MIFTTSCAGCNQPGSTLCRRCRFSLVSTKPVVTSDGIRAAMPYDGVGRQAVLGLKYRNRRGVARHLAALMVRRLQPEVVDVVTWAPTSPSNAGRRGFDQAEMLARAVARELGVPCRRLLYRSHGQSQSGHGRADRLQHTAAFRARAPRPGLAVLLVDDVVTTGATLRTARDSLLAAGVADVQCIAVAATPDVVRVNRRALLHLVPAC